MEVMRLNLTRFVILWLLVIFGDYDYKGKFVKYVEM